jgi:glutaredoxin
MDITVYTTSSCAICHSLMEWLDKEGQAYTRVVVDEDEQGMMELMNASGGAVGVPFRVIEKTDGTEEKIFGFDRNKFRATLGIA